MTSLYKRRVFLIPQHLNYIIGYSQSHNNHVSFVAYDTSIYIEELTNILQESETDFFKIFDLIESKNDYYMNNNPRIIDYHTTNKLIINDYLNPIISSINEIFGIIRQYSEAFNGDFDLSNSPNNIGFFEFRDDITIQYDEKNPLNTHEEVPYNGLTYVTKIENNQNNINSTSNNELVNFIDELFDIYNIDKVEEKTTDDVNNDNIINYHMTQSDVDELFNVEVFGTNLNKLVYEHAQKYALLSELPEELVVKAFREEYRRNFNEL